MANPRRTTIEINGRLYDAVTGQLLSHQADNAAPPSGGASIDGVLPPQNVTAEVKPPPPQPSQSSEPGASQPQTSADKMHHKVKKSRTLNRAVVTPPPNPIKPAPSQPAAAIDASTKQSLAAQVHAERKARAAGYTKSGAITKYSRSGAGQNLAEWPDTDAPQTPPAETTTVAVAPAAPVPTPKNELIARQLAAAANRDDGRAGPGLGQRLGNWVAQKRTSSLLATSLAAVLLIGYVTYVNIPRIALRVAASRAGFEAQMPSYSPGGFGFTGPVEYSPGEITVKFASHTDERYYTITQKETNIDSQSLLDNHVLGTTDYSRLQTYQERGLTVYIYDQGNTATWVNGGIWYTISGESDLTAEQLLKIAASL